MTGVPFRIQSKVVWAEPLVASHVLVVDDDADSREMLAELLTHQGFVAEVASNGQEALEKVHAHLPSVIILDMMMPVMDGWAFCERRRRDPELAAIPVVVLSAAPATTLQNVGATAVLQKPVDYDQLLSTIRSQMAN